MIVNTVRLLRRIQAGYRTTDVAVHAAADSCLSYLILHLKVDTLSLPHELVALYERLPEA